jgi:AraC family transcriptional regulator, regulatory protein of adaptative response / DNA-3-methyladenine glycosylase II
MKSRLECIIDWELRAEQARYRVANLSEVCGVTNRQLRRFFHEKFGCSPHAWMITKRLEKTKSVLTEGKLIKEVAFEAGFSQQENFSRQFKQYYGVPPSELRRQNSGSRQDVRF